jgi:MFS transporter, PAT family, beta-lactamase induction signal transducer AmpG
MKPPSLLRSKFFWVGVLYFAQGFPFGLFYDVLPVYFRVKGIALEQIGILALFGLSWTVKFLWAPAVDYFRHHRRWMFTVNLLMAGVMLTLAFHPRVDAFLWVAIGCFTLLSATNDIAIDGYTVELFKRGELGRANGLRIAFWRAGLLGAGGLLMLQPWIGWLMVYIGASVVLVLSGFICLTAPRESTRPDSGLGDPMTELRGFLQRPLMLLATLLVVIGLVAGGLRHPVWALPLLAAGIVMGVIARRRGGRKLAPGPMLGAFLEMVERPGFLPVVGFILLYKLADTTGGFMVKPFMVDVHLTPAEIGLISINLGLGLSILGGIVGGWITDRIGIFSGLWTLGIAQALPNLGYAALAFWLPVHSPAFHPDALQRGLIYLVSSTESFAQGLGTAAFLSLLMAIIDKRRSATEYAVLSSIFALSRSVAGWSGGIGAQVLGYGPFFVTTFFLAIPAYLLLPWIKKMLAYAEKQPLWEQR